MYIAKLQKTDDCNHIANFHDGVFMQNEIDWELYDALVRMYVKGFLHESEIIGCYNRIAAEQNRPQFPQIRNSGN